MLKDKIKRIKLSRLIPEERFLIETLDGIEKFTDTKYPNSVFYKKDEIILFEHDLKSNILWCNQKIIWSVFVDKYQYDYIHTLLIIKRIVNEFLDLENIRPSIHSINGSHVYNIVEDLTPTIENGVLISNNKLFGYVG